MDKIQKQLTTLKKSFIKEKLQLTKDDIVGIL